MIAHSTVYSISLKLRSEGRLLPKATSTTDLFSPQLPPARAVPTCTMLTPLPAAQWDRAKAAHLLRRAAFGGPPEQIDALAAGGMPAALAALVDGPAAPVPAPAPDWARPRDLAAYREEIRAAMAASAGDTEMARAEIRRNAGARERREQSTQLADLAGWWVNRMRDAQDPLEEKMTLFWHGHFATSAQKVRDAYLMWRQNQTFREHARGNFGVLTKAMSRDPAMIHWLDLRESRARHANENFARELMELFTLGEGNYTEKDVTEAARAFTGYRIDPRDQSFHFAPRDHDFGPKQFLRRFGNFHGDQIIDLILDQPACAQFIARKLWTFFACENADPALVDALAATLRAGKYELRPVLHQLFASQEFYSAQAMGTQVKSPVQFVVGTARLLETGLLPERATLGALKQLGQTPFAPPSVKGWDGGRAWISTSTLLFRYNLAGAFLKGGAARPVDLTALAPTDLRADPPALVRHLSVRLFCDPLSAKDHQTFVDYLKATGPRIDDKSVQGVLHLMMSTPRFQLC